MKKELIEKLKTYKTEQSDEDFQCDYDDQIEAYQQKGYNQAIDDIITLLQSTD